MAKKLGRPKKHIDFGKLEGMLLYDASMYVCADELGVSDDTLDRHVRQAYGMRFKELKERMTDKMALKLKTRLINKALDDGDNTCLIFALKNLGKWSDKVEHGVAKEQQAILLKYNLETKEEPKEE